MTKEQEVLHALGGHAWIYAEWLPNQEKWVYYPKEKPVTTLRICQWCERIENEDKDGVWSNNYETKYLEWSKEVRDGLNALRRKKL